MEILYYNKLDTKGVSKQFDKVVKFLEKDDFRSAEVKKIVNSKFFRAKLDYENRLLFQFVSDNNRVYILLLEIIFNHAYEKSKFLRGVRVDERLLKDIFSVNAIKSSDSEKMSYINRDTNSIYFLDKALSFDKEQNNILHFPPPVIIIGSAGSGKTALSLEKLKLMKGNILYTSLSSYLVDNSLEIYTSNGFDNDKQNIDFLSFHELIDSIEVPKTKEITFREFDGWFYRHKQSISIKESYKIYEEFKGVLTGGVINKSYLSKDEYLNLGIKQSIFTSSQKEEVYELFKKYLDFLKDKNYHDINILSHSYLPKVKKKYDFIFIDEVQDLTNIQLFLIFSFLKKSLQFVLSGDSNQIVHPNFFSWSNLKSLLFETTNKELNILKVLQTNYRNSPSITELSNKLLKIKNQRFGSIDKESTYLIKSISTKEGSVNFYKDSDNLKRELNKKIQKSTKFAILVMDNSQKMAIKKHFKTPLIFSIQEAKGLEYENIILVNFITTNMSEFKTISDGIEIEDLEKDLEFRRGKDKENKELEVYKFYINSLYVAFTRAVENLYIIEANKKHKILELLGLVKQQQKVTINVKQSTTEEWEKEAQKLKKQGKMEQYEAIEKELLKDKPKKVLLSEKELAELKKRAFNKKVFNKKDKDALYNYARVNMDKELLKKLSEFKYKKASNLLKNIEKDFRTFYNACRDGRIRDINKYINLYSLDFSNEDKLNGLMIGSINGNLDTIELFLNKGLDIDLRNIRGFTAHQLAILHYANMIKKDKTEEEFMTILDKLSLSYHRLKPNSIKYKIDNRVFKVYPNSMEYFLIIFFKTLTSKFYKDLDMENEKCLNVDDILFYANDISEDILPDYRKRRGYISAILANHEVNSGNPYTKRIFKRAYRGCYVLNPDMEVLNY